MNTIIFILSVLSALLTGGIKLVENLNKADDYLENGNKPQYEETKNDSTK